MRSLIGRRYSNKGFSSALVLTGLVVSSGLTPAVAELYFSEYIEGSSNNKALEIYNSGDQAVDLSHHSVEFYFNGNRSAGVTINLTGRVAPQSAYVLAQSNASAEILTKAHQTNSASWFNGDDAVVLTSGTQVVDVIGTVGIDPGIEWGAGLATTADNTLRRKVTVISGDSNKDDSFNPSLEWEGYPLNTVEDLGQYQTDNSGENPIVKRCGETATRISIIQGTGASSPLVNTPVEVEAIVVGDFQGDNQIGGFFLQEPDNNTDADANTSEGIYVSSRVSVALGDRIRVSGTASETFGLTQINPSAIQVCASDQPLPTPIRPRLPVPNLATFEAFEGMYAIYAQTLSVSDTFYLGRYGQLLLSSERLQQPTNVVEPGVAAQQRQAQNDLNKLWLDDGSDLQNPDPVIFPAPGLAANNSLRAGNTISNLTGVLSYSFGQYRLLPTQVPVFSQTNPRPDAVYTDPSANLRIASFNVLNFFNGDGQGGGFPTARGATNLNEFVRQKTKIISALAKLNSDIIGLIELENDGYGPLSAIAELTTALNQATGTDTWRYINPGRSQIGTDAITVGFIYRGDRAAAIGTSAVLDSSIDPQFIDTKNRPALAQSFRAAQGRGVVTLAVNHFKSKGSSCADIGDPDTGDGQGNCNLTRTRAAQALITWLNQNPTGITDSDRLIIGDLNAYAKEDPIQAIKGAGYSDVIDQFNDATYSYVFEGQAGYLDHGLASTSLTSQVLGAVEWHINADEPVSLDYNTEFKTSAQITDFYDGNAYRSSDHDPVVISLKLVIDLDGDGDVDKNDLQIITAARNTVARGIDQRDVNNDGVINLNDARTLSLQCTRLQCATE